VLYDQAVVITASRESWEIIDSALKGKLDYYLYLVPKLRIENLKKKEAFALMENLYCNLNINVQDKTQMFADVFHVSRGNPKMIAQIFEKARKPEYLKENTLSLNLILIDCKMEKI